MAKHNPTTKTRRQTALHGTDTPEIEKFKKVFGPVRDARLALLALSRPHLIKVPDMTSQEAQTLAKKLGLDPKAVERKAARVTAEVLRAAERYRAQVIKQSPKAKRFLDSAKAAWVTGGQVVTTGGISQGGVTRYYVDTPFLIWPTQPLLVLDTATIQPNNSSVTFHYHRDGPFNDPQEVSIFFRWTNPSDYPTTISVHGYMVFSGTGQAHARGAWLNADGTALVVYGYVEVYGDWDPTLTLLGSASDEPISLFATPEGLFYKHSVTQSSSVFRGYDLGGGTDQIAIPANGEITLNLAVKITNVAVAGGYVDLDFSSDAFGVTAPGILITKYL